MVDRWYGGVRALKPNRVPKEDCLAPGPASRAAGRQEILATSQMRTAGVQVALAG
jgi:hypothetical protein